MGWKQVSQCAWLPTHSTNGPNKTLQSAKFYVHTQLYSGISLINKLKIGKQKEQSSHLNRQKLNS